ncbi:hypothetical protein [Mesorhizobium sp.]|uniref:hypothetical protein n=1 Tax=Mesorhizobium sp. TaxID=1871066 RepID=UPI0012067020|nr:hypothetical protein [Mesorhizobium sp.]TIO10315.1 MAG: hypothetical protein E5X88_04285 [Mesorhizobium sp.]TIO36656.1 MAG: hypothetical protein E5X89_01230 [Mesorhizobium sp.]TIP13683.1 MAG: hypothetical protein E5X73_06160 [Mesorhizobium sp.]
MKADILSFPKAPQPLRLGRGMRERGRLASKRDQQKGNPVLRACVDDIRHACFIVSAGVMKRRASGFLQHLTRWNGTARHRIECHIL